MLRKWAPCVSYLFVKDCVNRAVYKKKILYSGRIYIKFNRRRKETYNHVLGLNEHIQQYICFISLLQNVFILNSKDFSLSTTGVFVFFFLHVAEAGRSYKMYQFLCFHPFYHPLAYKLRRAKVFHYTNGPFPQINRFHLIRYLAWVT